MVAQPTSPGWYADPRGGTVERWWNGISWSADVRPAGATTPPFDGSNGHAEADDRPGSVRPRRRRGRLPRRVFAAVLVVNVVLMTAVLVPSLSRALVTRNLRSPRDSGGRRCG